MNENHVDLLRKWLRSKSLHVADIKAALEWYSSEVLSGREPSDADVLAKAEEGHRVAVEQAVPIKEVIHDVSTQYVPFPMIDLDWLRKRIIGYSVIGTGSALALYEVIKWVLVLIA